MTSRSINLNKHYIHAKRLTQSVPYIHPPSAASSAEYDEAITSFHYKEVKEKCSSIYLWFFILASKFESETKRRRIQKVLSSSEESIEESILPSPPKRRIDNERVSESNTKNINGEDHQENKSLKVMNNLLDSSVLLEVSVHPKESNGTHNDMEDYCCKGCQQNANKLKTVIEQNHLLRSLATDILLDKQEN
ncbi:hypothetical protein JTB14_012568 [Gonioctena quinquepunctata]|nr:hypothetical protein JTB14_012568 [Gonioctena quinquepunctata]